MPTHHDPVPTMHEHHEPETRYVYVDRPSKEPSRMGGLFAGLFESLIRFAFYVFLFVVLVVGAWFGILWGIGKATHYLDGVTTPPATTTTSTP